MAKVMDTMEPITIPHYAYTFKFEEDFEPDDKRAWMQQNWNFVFYCVSIYMILIFGGQHYMQSRPRFELRKPLACWNIFLALFSIIGATRTAQELVHMLSNYGFYHSVCIPSFIENNSVSGFWTWMFTLSKVPELADTVFIVLRKQPLIFLHWYHHVTVLLCAWYSFTEFVAPGRWFVVMNYTVHSVMYSYYAFKALRYRVPRFVSMCITTLQIIQMFAACFINIWIYQAKQNGIECHMSYENIKVCLLIYISYFVLFGHFFYNSYLKKKDLDTKRAPVATAKSVKEE